MGERDDEVTALLKRARKRISDPERWTWGQFAEDQLGGSALPKSRAAERWCAVGALEAEAPCVGREGFGLVRGAYRRLQEALGHDPFRPQRLQAVEAFNDRCGLEPEGHRALLAVFDEAIRAK